MLMCGPPTMAAVTFARSVTEAVQFGVSALPWLLAVALAAVVLCAVADAA